MLSYQLFITVSSVSIILGSTLLAFVLRYFLCVKKSSSFSRKFHVLFTSLFLAISIACLTVWQQEHFQKNYLDPLHDFNNELWNRTERCPIYARSCSIQGQQFIGCAMSYGYPNGNTSVAIFYLSCEISDTNGPCYNTKYLECWKVENSYSLAFPPAKNTEEPDKSIALVKVAHTLYVIAFVLLFWLWSSCFRKQGTKECGMQTDQETDDKPRAPPLRNSSPKIEMVVVHGEEGDPEEQSLSYGRKN